MKEPAANPASVLAISRRGAILEEALVTVGVTSVLKVQLSR